MKEAICPDHRSRSTDFVALNAKQEPVCAKGGPIGSHYFTVCSEAKARLADTAAKKGGKRVRS